MLERIVVTGAHSTGKTTLCEALLTDLNASEAGLGGRKWGLVSEAARRVMQSEEWRREDVSKLEFQQAISREHLRLESTTPTPYISDRCLLDQVAYTRLTNSDPLAYLVLLNDPAAAASFASYRDRKKTLVVHLYPVAAFVHDDGVRTVPTGMEEWWEVSREFERTMREAEVEWKSLGEEVVGLKERVELVKGWMRQASQAEETKEL
ncbi:hypothetical protein JCM8097_002209 [Rhodosporidiobolus ruineniae]